MGLGVVRLEPDRRAVFGDRLIQLSLVCQGDAEIVVGRGEVILEPDGRAVLGDRLIELALLVQCLSEVEVGGGVLGTEPNGRGSSATASARFPWRRKARPRL